MDTSIIHQQLSGKEHKRYVNFCYSFYDTTNLILGTSYPTSNLYLLHVWQIQYVLQESLSNGDEVIRSMGGKDIDKWGCQKNLPPEYPRVIPVIGRVWRKILPLRVMRMGILNIYMLNRAGVEITIPIPVGTRYEIIILPLNYQLS